MFRREKALGGTLLHSSIYKVGVVRKMERSFLPKSVVPRQGVSGRKRADLDHI